MVLRMTGQEAWTDPVAFAAGTTIAGVALDPVTNLVASTSTVITVTAAVHSGRQVILNSTHTTTVTLPASTGGGDIYTFRVGVTGTDGSKIIQVANSTDIIQGASIAANTQSTTIGFLTSATSDTVTMNNTTSGGLLGSVVQLIDIAVGKYLGQVFTITTGNPTTPWSAAVP
ncbi:MAG: hypothetical protein V4510_11450 [bacterium]